MKEINKIKNTNKFTWGTPITFYEVGPYTVLEFHPWIIEGCRVITGQPNKSEHSFHGWVDGRNVNESWPTLEAALAGLMGLKWTGKNNGGIGYYFCKMVGAPPYNQPIQATTNPTSCIGKSDKQAG